MLLSLLREFLGFPGVVAFDCVVPVDEKLLGFFRQFRKLGLVRIRPTCRRLNRLLRRFSACRLRGCLGFRWLRFGGLGVGGFRGETVMLIALASVRLCFLWFGSRFRLYLCALRLVV